MKGCSVRGVEGGGADAVKVIAADTALAAIHWAEVAQ